MWTESSVSGSEGIRILPFGSYGIQYRIEMYLPRDWEGRAGITHDYCTDTLLFLDIAFLFFYGMVLLDLHNMIALEFR